MKLQKHQQAAYDDFKAFGYAFIEAPRRSGKTTLLQHIARETDGKVLLITPNYAHYKQLGWADIKNVRRVTAIPKNAKGQTIIGDEIELRPDGKNKIICAFTRPFVTQRWSIKSNSFIPHEELPRLEKEMPSELFRSEFY